LFSGGLVVTRLDRLARSTRDLLNILDTIGKAGAGFKSLGDAWADTTTNPGGGIFSTGERADCGPTAASQEILTLPFACNSGPFVCAHWPESLLIFIYWPVTATRPAFDFSRQRVSGGLPCRKASPAGLQQSWPLTSPATAR
jgi:hypothetical protein